MRPRWYSAMSDKIDKMQAVELEVAGNIVARSQVLRRDAEQSALLNAIVTTVILFLVLIATLAVARSLVQPLRRLREGALDIATVQLPERVRRLGEETDPATSLDVAPIDVVSADEIGQVARAFDQVHAEAVRLAGNEAMLRSSFNAMFVNLSRIFSPRDTPVHISGEEIPSGGVLIEVSDSGVGIPEARLTEMNLRLDNPPVIDVSVSRHMGLFAVARLAERHGARVRLRARPPRGLIALVWLPDTVTEHGTAPSPWSGGRLERQAAGRVRITGQHAADLRAAPDGQPASGQTANGWSAAGPASVPSLATTPMPAVPTPVVPTLAVLTPAAAAPREPAQAGDSKISDWFRSPRSSAPGNSAPGESAPGDGGSAAAAVREGGWRAGADEWAESRHAAEIVAEPVRGDHTVAGLPVRVPRANLIAGSAGSHRAGGATGRLADGRGTQTAPAARAPRSPEHARSRLSGFQRGTRRAKGQTPRAGEGADR
jgi:hypothetical protein